MKTELTEETLLDWYEQMWTIRYFEENAINSFRQGLFTGSTHPCIGQEAIAVGGAAALQPTDQVFATYRGHGHAIAKGLDPNSLMAELLCKATGCSGGRGGSMHLCDVDKDFWGTNAVVAAHIPIAGGMALANKLRRNNRVTVVYFGDGATCEGAFFETLNMAVLWQVPLVLVCENNGYAISVPTHMAIPLENIAQRADGFGLPGITVDGNDPVEVFNAMSTAVSRARDGAGPTLVECKTVRWERHSAISAGKYENEEEAMKWKKVDPIPRFEKALREQGLPATELEARREQAKAVNDEALEFAKDSESPAPETVAEFVFAL
ncbi:MAG TPA: thiamine pyrophosphate-dependent dehydrogenase E1 component subunit alpha [Abditibacteriaceae bacterium]|nr:thiamine pyrophosphate-dependent dehydrogenase E1 component subunit alpha [Abditibacteriaceae bacterium]